MDFVGLLSIVIGLVLLIYLVYAGWPVLIVAPLAAMFVMVLNGIPLISGYTETYMGGVADFVLAQLPIFLWGAIFGEIYNISGAALSIAKAITKLFKGKKEKMSNFMAILIIFFVGVLLSYGGISGIVLMFVLMPLVLGVLKEVDIPRYMAPGILLGSIATAALSMPGSPQIQNAMPITYLGTSSLSGLIPGIVGGIIVLALNIIYLTKASKKEQAKGFGFLSVEGESFGLPEADLPKPFVALIPMILTFILFNFANVNINFAIILGSVLGIILFLKQIRSYSKFFKAMEGAVANTCIVLLSAGAVAGFGSVVAVTDSFAQLSNQLTSMSGMPPLFIAMIAIIVITAVCGSGPAGLGASLPMFSQTFAVMGINMSALHRVAAFSATTLDTLPTNAGFIAAAGIANTTVKKSYKYVGVCTVINTTIGTVIVTLLLILFPGLA